MHEDVRKQFILIYFIYLTLLGSICALALIKKKTFLNDLLIHRLNKLHIKVFEQSFFV